MLTGAERNSLALTVGFLLLGSGIKLWKKSQVEIGPFDTAGPASQVPSVIAGASFPAPAVPAGSAPGPEAATSVGDSLDGGAGNPAARQSVDVDPRSANGAVEAAAGGGEADRDEGIASGWPPSKASAKPGQRTARKAATKTPPDHKLDANRATADELTAIPGIGPKLAAAIVAYRREHGPFRQLTALREVKGIGEKKWAVIAPCLTIAEAGPRARAEDAQTGPETDAGEGTGRP